MGRGLEVGDVVEGSQSSFVRRFAALRGAAPRGPGDGGRVTSWLGYQTAEDRVPRCGERMKTSIRSGDRLGLFPHRMAMLVV